LAHFDKLLSVGSGYAGERDRDALAEALNAADCRTIQAAKSLDTSALESIPQELRQNFLQRIADANVQGEKCGVVTSSICIVCCCRRGCVRQRCEYQLLSFQFVRPCMCLQNGDLCLQQ
jgi:hypothetical protein